MLARFAYFFLIGERGVGRFVQSLSLGIGLVLVGLIIALFGVQADIASKHRQLTQDVLYRLKKLDLGGKEAALDSDGVELLTDPPRRNVSSEP